MKKIHKVFVFSFVLFVITPSLALASWWNPVSWFDFIFHKTNSVEIVQTISTTTGTQIVTSTPQVQVASSTIGIDQQDVTPPIKKKPVVKQINNVVTTPNPTPVPATISTSTPTPVSVTLCLNGMTLASNCATVPNGTATTIEPTLLLESQPQYLCPNAMTLTSNCTLPANAVAVPLCPNGTTLASNCATLPNGTAATAIEPIPSQAVQKTDQQICTDSYGQNSSYSGNRNDGGGPVCNCKNGYLWNSNRTSCQLQQQPTQQPSIQTSVPQSQTFQPVTPPVPQGPSLAEQAQCQQAYDQGSASLELNYQVQSAQAESKYQQDVANAQNLAGQNGSYMGGGERAIEQGLLNTRDMKLLSLLSQYNLSLSNEKMTLQTCLK
jgi:hypothetical protein